MMKVLSKLIKKWFFLRAEPFILSRPRVRILGRWTEDSGFYIKNIRNDLFKLRFVDGITLLNHHLIRIFDKVEFKLNKEAERIGEIVLTIPFATIE